MENVSDVLEFRASLINMIWYGVRNNKKYIIDIPDNICNRLKYIYSTEANDYWKVGTIREHFKLNVDDYEPSEYWTAFRSGLKFKGIIRDNQIRVDWTKHDLISKKEYERSNSKAITEQPNGVEGVDGISKDE